MGCRTHRAGRVQSDRQCLKARRQRRPHRGARGWHSSKRGGVDGRKHRHHSARDRRSPVRSVPGGSGRPAAAKGWVSASISCLRSSRRTAAAWRSTPDAATAPCFGCPSRAAPEGGNPTQGGAYGLQPPPWDNRNMFGTCKKHRSRANIVAPAAGNKRSLFVARPRREHRFRAEYARFDVSGPARAGEPNGNGRRCASGRPRWDIRRARVGRGVAHRRYFDDYPFPFSCDCGAVPALRVGAGVEAPAAPEGDAVEPPFVLCFRNPSAVVSLVLGRDPLRLADAYFRGDVDIEGNLFAALCLGPPGDR